MNISGKAGGALGRAVLIGIFLVLLPSSRRLSAQNLEIAGGFDAMFYDKAKVKLSTEPGSFIHTRALLEGYLGGIFVYNLDFIRDTVFNYMASMRIGVTMKHFTFGIGYYFSSDEWQFERIDRGLSGKIALILPDIFFFSAMYAASLSAYVVIPGNRTLHQLDAEMGFWLYNMLLSARIERKESATTENADFIKIFSRLKVFTRLEIFGKNAPFSFRFEGGIFSMGANYENNAGETGKDDSFFVFGGGRLNIHPSRHFTWFVSAEFPFNISGNLSGFLFNAETGIIITVLSP